MTGLTLLFVYAMAACRSPVSPASAFIWESILCRKVVRSPQLGLARAEATVRDAVPSPDPPGKTATRAEDDGGGGRWASRALLFSSLTDGVEPNLAARSFLGHSLADALLRERISREEDGVRASAEFSPCNGPDVEALGKLERADRLHERGRRLLSDGFPFGDELDAWADETLEHLASDGTSGGDVRVLYIPTAMYALNPQSSSTPGKQRQRARADGKKRRTRLLALLAELLGRCEGGRRFNLLATTLDLDDGSLKQPFGSDDPSSFPRTAAEALSAWRPHVIYVEGGNTFWLRHCVEKGGYLGPIRDACAGPHGTIYCGKSAGAIVAGSSVETAAWKGWDDPSVVPGRETCTDWTDSDGLDLAGGRSFFPHMSDDWTGLVEERTEAGGLGGTVQCLREEEAFCVVGGERLAFLTRVDDGPNGRLSGIS